MRENESADLIIPITQLHSCEMYSSLLYYFCNTKVVRMNLAAWKRRSNYSNGKTSTAHRHRAREYLVKRKREAVRLGQVKYGNVPYQMCASAVSRKRYWWHWFHDYMKNLRVVTWKRRHVFVFQMLFFWNVEASFFTRNSYLEFSTNSAAVNSRDAMIAIDWVERLNQANGEKLAEFRNF